MISRKNSIIFSILIIGLTAIMLMGSVTGYCAKDLQKGLDMPVQHDPGLIQDAQSPILVEKTILTKSDNGKQFIALKGTTFSVMLPEFSYANYWNASGTHGLTILNDMYLPGWTHQWTLRTDYIGSQEFNAIYIFNPWLDQYNGIIYDSYTVRIDVIEFPMPTITPC